MAPDDSASPPTAAPVSPARRRTFASPQVVQPLAIIALSTLAAVGYGLVHDQITIRLCPQYFTVTHPKITSSTSLTIIALAWGVVGTWKIGAALGLLLAVAARVGTEPRVPARRLVRPILALIAANALLASASGVAGYALARLDLSVLEGELAANLPDDVHDLWITTLWVHSSSYLGGGIGGLLLVAWVLRVRWRMREI